MTTTDPRRGVAQFFTFYSFKGGVGRSMALINTAAQLARRGRQVLAIDLDLEAPGISYLSSGKDDAILSLGFIDAIYDLLHNPTSSPLVAESPRTAIEKYSRPLDLKQLAQGEDSGVIRIMPAGCLNNIAEYQQRLTKIDFSRLYREGIGVRVLEHFKKVLIAAEDFDYILVDSRTGLSTEAGIAVRDLADHLVVVMGLNHQNVTGTADFLKLISNGEPKPKSLSVVLSPMPLGEDDLAEERIKVAESALRLAWSGELAKPLASLQIPYHPRLSLQENPHIARLTTRPLTQAYSQLERHVRSLAGDTIEAYTNEAHTLIIQNRWSDALSPLIELKRFGAPAARFMIEGVLRDKSGERAFDPYAALLSEFAAEDLGAARISGEHFARSGRVRHAERIMRAYLTTHPKSNEAWDEICEWWFRLAGNYERADAIYQEGLNYLSENADFLGNYAMFLWHTFDKPDRAAPFYERSVEIAQNDARLIDNYALFLWTARGDFENAEVQFKRALSISPNDGNTLANYGEMLLGQGRLREAKQCLQRAWQNRHAEHRFVTLEILYRAGLYSLIVGNGDQIYLQQLSKLMQEEGFEGEFVNFERITSVVQPKLSEDDFTLYRTLGDVLSRKSKISALRKLQKWKAIRPTSLKDELFSDDPHGRDVNPR